MRMNMENWIKTIIQKQEVVAIPVMTHPGIELNGKTVREAVSNGTVHYEAVMTLCERYLLPCLVSLYLLLPYYLFQVFSFVYSVNHYLLPPS